MDNKKYFLTLILRLIFLNVISCEPLCFRQDVTTTSSCSYQVINSSSECLYEEINRSSDSEPLRRIFYLKAVSELSSSQTDGVKIRLGHILKDGSNRTRLEWDELINDAITAYGIIIKFDETEYSKNPKLLISVNLINIAKQFEIGGVIQIYLKGNAAISSSSCLIPQTTQELATNPLITESSFPITKTTPVSESSNFFTFSVPEIREIATKKRSSNYDCYSSSECRSLRGLVVALEALFFLCVSIWTGKLLWLKRWKQERN